jgi:hypothetical protein
MLPETVELDDPTTSEASADTPRASLLDAPPGSSPRFQDCFVLPAHGARTAELEAEAEADGGGAVVGDSSGAASGERPAEGLQPVAACGPAVGRRPRDHRGPRRGGRKQRGPHGIVVKPPAMLCALLPNSVAESRAIIVKGSWRRASRRPHVGGGPGAIDVAEAAGACDRRS